MAALRVEPGAAGVRLDRWLAERLPALSRAKLQALIADGHVRLDGRVPKPSHTLRGGERVEIEIPPPPAEALEPEATPLVIVHEDAHVLVVDKPAGMVVHPGAGHARGTLAAAALAHAPGIAGVGGPRRPGIVHRLDKDTSGLLVLAKTPAAYDALVAQLASRTVTRTYLAVVHGRVRRDAGVIDAPIGRHPHARVKMAVRPAGRGKRAVTRYRVLERFKEFTYLALSLETGRTHQIRVHLAALGHPVAGDDVYGGGRVAPPPVAVDGYALHAAQLAFAHPATGAHLEFTAPLPARMERLLSHLRHSAAPGRG
ncbi:MAG: RluA family pseudouridine synthase [Candidatus Rokubacteria bacterium]|nr:RluA family pseudouridine synthase [Candidatus Rokubacteria bacterium]